MSAPFLGAIALFAFNFPPKRWSLCNGQLLPIAQNQALFSLLGTTYGGNGTTTFALPDLRGRVPISFGQGPGLSPYSLGQSAGTENVTLTQQQLPLHNHAMPASTNDADSSKPDTTVFAKGGAYAAAPATTTMSPQAVANAGGNQAHTNLQPYQTLSYCIALQGIFPSRS